MALNEEKGRTVLVTGGAKRIGAAIARGLAEDGWNVCVHYQNSEAEALQLARALTQAGRRCFAVKADLSCRRTSKRWFRAASNRRAGSIASSTTPPASSTTIWRP